MKIAIDIPNPKCGKFCSFRCQYYAKGIKSDTCHLFGSLRRVKKDDGRIHWMSYQHKECLKAQTTEFI